MILGSEKPHLMRVGGKWYTVVREDANIPIRLSQAAWVHVASLNADDRIQRLRKLFGKPA